MLELAMMQYGAQRTVLVMQRPGHLGVSCARLGMTVLDGVVDPWPLIEAADLVHAASGSDAALIALMAGRSLAGSSRTGAASVDDPLRRVAAVLLLGTRYVDPFTGQSMACESFLDLAEGWRRHAATNAEIACCVGISFWKRQRIGTVLNAARAPAFRRTARAAVAVAARRGGAIAAWASRQPPGLAALAQASGVRVLRLEDGFIRSVGLGAEFRPPLSVVLDRLGLYYDATGPSDLEEILANARFDPALLDRAAALRLRVVRDGVTKYNLTGEAIRLRAAAGQRTILVPGQVADDRSVLLGGGGISPGLDLLARVRRRVPSAYIVYKPHPDVEAGFRPGKIDDAFVLGLADQVVHGGCTAALLDRVDEVHTLTSLTGFEALLRGKLVTTYGQPFYAGWGLATDLNPLPWRTRRLSLDALVAGALILYPRYIDPVTLLPCGPEVVLDRLADPALHTMTTVVRLRCWQGMLLAWVARIGPHCAGGSQVRSTKVPASCPKTTAA